MQGSKRGNVKLIEGAGKYGGYRGDVLTPDQAEDVARYISGGRIGADAITFEGYKDHLLEPLPTGPYAIAAGKISKADIKSWNDRNNNNADTKLSKEKPLGPRKMPRLPDMYPDNKPKKRIKKGR